MGDLDKLIEAVEAGEWATGLHLPYELHTDLLWKAFNGSLDAALRLHNALLPGWDYSIDNVQRVKPFVYVVDDGGPEFHAEAGTPARAFLLAILRALQAQPTPPISPEEAQFNAIRHHERFGPLDEKGNPLDPRRRG